MAAELGVTPAKLQHLRQAPFHQAVKDLAGLKDEARRNYRRLALKYHPDQNRSEDATEVFVLLGQVLKEIEALQVSPPPAPARPVVEEDLGSSRTRPSYFQWQSAGVERPYNARRVAFMKG